MWLYMIGGFLLLVGIVGGVLSGGIFTIVLLPLGVIALASAYGYAAWARQAHGEAGAGADADSSSTTGGPLPGSDHSNVASAPTSPEQLADARRQQQ